MSGDRTEKVAGYAVDLGLAYDPATHMWVDLASPGTVRAGLDPLGVETSGTLAALGFVGVGTAVARGEALGSLEAEKFVGPVLAPVSGIVTAVNGEVLAHPGAVEADPYEAWLVEIQPADLGSEIAFLVQGPAQVKSWFAAQVAEYKRMGVLAE